MRGGPPLSALRGLVLLGLAFAFAGGGAVAQTFPQGFTHMYGQTVVPARPVRVVSLGFVGHDNLLALGVVPVALRYWYGPFANGLWPWAEGRLAGETPVVLRGEISFERIAMLRPDLILAVSSGISAQDYRMLSRIAPTIASEARYGDYGTPWEVQALTAGRATGREAEARARIAAVNARFAALRAAHPEWAGMTAVAAAAMGGEPAAFLEGDVRADVLRGLGFRTPPALEAHRGESFYLPLSPENLGALDADLLVWMTGSQDAGAVAGLALRPSLRAVREGREVWADEILAGAMGYATLLSLPYVLDRLEAELPAALDGDPATPVPSAVAAGLAR